MIFQTQENALLTRVVEALLIRSKAVGHGLLFAQVFRLGPGKHADVRCAHRRCVVDPLFRVGDLLRELLTFGQREVVSHRSASQTHTAKVSAALHLIAELGIGIRREEIARHLGSRHLVVTAPVHEVQDAPGLRITFRLLLLVAAPLERITERVSGHAEHHAAFARALNGLDGWQRGDAECAKTGGEKMSA